MKRCFVDLDDTLIGYKVRGRNIAIYAGYSICIQDMCDLLIRHGFEEKEIKETQDNIYKKMVSRRGFGHINSFPFSFKATYRLIAKKHGIKPDHDITRQAESLGWQVFEFAVSPLPGALETLEKIARKFEVTIVTKGFADYQIKKARDSGCLEISSSLVVMESKSPKEWREKIVTPFLSEPDIPKSWVVGDSIKSDINPSLNLGLNAIHVKSHDFWNFEDALLCNPKDGQLLHVVDSIKNVPKYLK